MMKHTIIFKIFNHTLVIVMEISGLNANIHSFSAKLAFPGVFLQTKIDLTTAERILHRIISPNLHSLSHYR